MLSCLPKNSWLMAHSLSMGMTAIIEHEWAQRKHVNLKQMKHESTKRNDTTFLLLSKKTQRKPHSLCLCSHLRCWTMCSTSCKDPIPLGWLPQLLPGRRKKGTREVRMQPWRKGRKKIKDTPRHVRVTREVIWSWIMSCWFKLRV